jgi:hypothetical protein
VEQSPDLHATIGFVPPGLDLPSSVMIVTLLSEQGQMGPVVRHRASRYAVHAFVAELATPWSVVVQQSGSCSMVQSASVAHALYAAGRAFAPASRHTMPPSPGLPELLELPIPGGPPVLELPALELPVLDDAAVAAPLPAVVVVPPVPVEPVPPAPVRLVVLLELVPPMACTSPLPQATSATHRATFPDEVE